MRVFAALPLPGAVRTDLAAALEPLRSGIPGIRWVNAAGFHITLHFFGETTPERVGELTRALADPRLGGPPFPARLGGLGQFPPARSPRVLWVALDGGAEEARRRWEALQEVIAPLGWQPDPRGFTPHVTVGRAGREHVEPIDLSRFEVPSLEFAFTEIVLFESMPGKGGAVYNPLALAAFDGHGS